MITDDTIQILLIEDEDYDVRRVRNTLTPFEKQLIIKDIVSNGYDALKLLKSSKNNYDVVIMDFQLVGDLAGETLIRKIKEVDPSIQIIVITKMTVHVTDFNFANQLLEAGAMWYCTKYPGDIENYIYQPTDFILSIFNAYERRQIIKSQLRAQKKLNQNISLILEEKPIIGNSETIKQLREQILQCAQSEATLLIRGQSGTGKELVAAHIHYNSSRKYEKFVAVNCGSLPAELIESELFGFEQGAFTGAKHEKPGLFEVANNGTLFLDEIGELPLGAQVKLLRALQEGEIDKIGRIDKVKVNVRIIAATNKNLEEEVRQKRFREDLYYRLNVITIQLLPLQHRSEDIVQLVEYFLHKFCHEMGRSIPEISPQAWDSLKQYSWPGNVRELQNVVQRLLFINTSPLTAAHVKNALGLGTQLTHPENAFSLPSEVIPLKEIEREFRKTYFEYVRKQTKSDADAAKLLGLAPPNFYRMCKELGIK